MAAPIDLRNDFDSVSLRRLAKRTRDATQSRRLLALAEVYDGGSRTDASRIGGVGLQIIRDWVLRFNARGPDGLVDGKSPGAPSKLNADHRRALAEVVEAGPVPAVDGVVRWRRKDLARWLLETFAISLDETTVGRELKALGFAKISARPRHYAQNELAVEALKKTSPPVLATDAGRCCGKAFETWGSCGFEMLSGIGWRNKPALGPDWPDVASRGRAPRDWRTGLGRDQRRDLSRRCRGKVPGGSEALVPMPTPWRVEGRHARSVPPSIPAVPCGTRTRRDQAGWQMTPKLAIPDNMEGSWRCRHDRFEVREHTMDPRQARFMGDNWLSNRIFKSLEDMVALWSGRPAITASTSHRR